MTRLPDRYASTSLALWRAEHPLSPARFRWLIRPVPASRRGGGSATCVACQKRVHATMVQRTFEQFIEWHVARCDVIQAYETRLLCVRWLAALPDVPDDALSERAGYPL